MARGEGAKVKDLFSDDDRFINEVIGEKPNIEVRGRKELDKFYPALKKGRPCRASTTASSSWTATMRRAPAPSKCA